MRKMCPRCHGGFEAQFLCPNCGVQLLSATERAGALSRRFNLDSLPAAGMVTRFAAGWLLAQGAYYGIRQIATACFLALGEPDSLGGAGDVANPLLMLLSVLAGSLIAGAGNPRGMAAGAALGLLHAFALIGARFGLGHWPGSAMLFAGWLFLTLAGAIGGRLGRRIWPPLSDLDEPERPTKATALIAGPTVKRARQRVPIAWLRVFGGAALSIGCTVWAGPIREFIIGTSGGRFTVDSRLQIHFVTWIISALAMMIGGVFAGASTRSGLRHGLLVGILACVGIFVIHSQVVHEGLPAEHFFAAVIGLPETSAESPFRIGLFLITNALALGIFGGWFGAALLPRVVSGPSRLDRGSI